MARGYFCGGGFSGVDCDDATAVEEDILEGRTAGISGKDDLVQGRMPERGDWGSTELAAGASIIIPGGHHSGKGKVTAKSLASQTPGNLVANKMLAGTYGWSGGKRFDGEIASQGAITLKPGTTVKTGFVSGKYMTGDITVPAVSVPANVIKNGHKLTFPDGSSVTGNVKELKFRYIAVTSGTSADIDYGNGYMYSLRFTVDIIPIMGWALNYRGNRKRDISIWHNQDGVGKIYDAVNLNQDMRWDMFSIGLDDGEGGCSLFSKNLVIPVSYGGETYGCWIVGH